VTKKVRKILTGLLSVVLVIGLAGVAWSFWGYRTGEEDYSEAENLAVEKPVETSSMQEQETPREETIPEEPTEGEPAVEVPPAEEEKESELPEVLTEINLQALRDVNADVLGWIQIPGTRISYPLMRGTDNDYYLEHTWQKKRSAVGAIFMDYRNNSDFSDFNTVIYGHNMKDDSMFGGLHDFKNKAFLDAHPCVNIIDEAELREYRIFAVYEASVSTAEAYQMSFAGEEERQAFLDQSLSLSAVDTDVKPTVEDEVITLSTCTGRGYSTRWVVQAVLQNSD